MIKKTIIRTKLSFCASWILFFSVYILTISFSGHKMKVHCLSAALCTYCSELNPSKESAKNQKSKNLAENNFGRLESYTFSFSLQTLSSPLDSHFRWSLLSTLSPFRSSKKLFFEKFQRTSKMAYSKEL